MTKSQIFPESCYNFKKLSREQVIEAKENGDTLTGYVESILGETEELEVTLGDNLSARLPFSEVTIYPLHHTANSNRVYPIQIEILLHKKIRVKVTDVTGDQITLSRKQNMLEAYEHLAKCDSAYFHITNVEQAFAYGDIGDGINARLYIREISRNHIKSVSEEFHRGDKVWVAIISANDKKQFELSYRKMFRPYNPDDYKPGDPVQCKVTVPVDDMMTGYYTSVTPQVRGIVDTDQVLQYGDRILCTVNRAAEKGLKLRLVRVLKEENSETTETA